MNLQLRHSIAWQMIVPIPLTVIATIAAAWLLVPRMIADNATHQAILASRNMAAQVIAIRKYYTDNIVDKVVREGTFRASPDYKDDARAIPLPATMTHDLGPLLSRQGTEIHLYSKFPFPRRANRQLDVYQQEAWEFLVRHPQGSYFRTETRDGRQIVRVAVADTMTAQACVNCHNSTAASPKTDWKLGDVRGVLEIDSSIDSQLASGATLSRFIIFGAIAIGLILTGITLVVARSVTQPIGGLIDAMRNYTAGRVQTAIPGLGRKDEIGQLATAFNTMISDLAAAQEREAADHARAARMQAELTRVARFTARGQTVASIAHEINQPLAAIVTNGNAGLRWLALSPPDLDEVRKALNAVVNDGHRASDIIGNLRAIFSRSDAERAPLDVNDLIREVVGMLHGELRGDRISVQTELANALPNVIGNRVQLQLVLRNLIVNASDAMSSITDRDRVLQIRSEVSGSSGVRISVADSGTGIPQESIDRIFDHFYTTKTHGMGVGLSICRSIVENHGGQLAASRLQPFGTVFELVLPAAEAEG
jgi:signal transduction histidine kinase